MIAESLITRSAPAVPVEDWRQSFAKRTSNLGMRTLAKLAGTSSRVFGNRAGSSLGILVHHRIAPLVRGSAYAALQRATTTIPRAVDRLDGTWVPFLAFKPSDFSPPKW